MGLEPKMRGFHFSYVLEGTKVVPVDVNTDEGHKLWAKFAMSDKRVLFRTRVKGLEVSTVFLTIDYGGFMEGPPVVFETMIFRGSWTAKFCWRYCTYKQAKAGHILTCAMVGGYRLPRKTKKGLNKCLKSF